MPVSPGAWNIIHNIDDLAKNMNDISKMNTADEQAEGIVAEIFKESVNQLNKMVYDTPERGYRRTGALRRSGRFKKLKKLKYKISYGGAGTNVNYATFVHEGTTKIPPRPFLVRAVLKYKPKADKIFKKVINTVKRGA